MPRQAPTVPGREEFTRSTEPFVLPILLGSGVPLSPGPAPGQGSQGSTPLRLLRSDRTFPDGSVELVYEPGRAALI